MKCLVVDTNVLIGMFAHGDTAPEAFKGYDRILLPSIVIGEYRAGITESRAGRESARKLAFFRGHNTVDTVSITDRTSELYAKVFQALKECGRPIPQNDMWIAASSLEHCADLATYDEHFKAVPMLSVIIP